MNGERWELIFSGMVQGVGFRFTSFQVARRYNAREYNVQGFVQNLSDGRVKMVIEGDSAILEEYVAEVIRSTHGRVRDTQKSTKVANGEFGTFEIR